MQPTLTFALAGGPGVQIAVQQSDTGTLQFTATVANAAMAADLRGLFFHVADETLLAGLQVTQASSAVPAVRISANGVSNLGAGVSMLGSARPFDVGIAFGSASIAGADNIRSVSFTLEHSSQALSLDLLSSMQFGAVMTSVGPSGGARFATAKAVGAAPSTIAPVAANDTQATAEDTPLAASVAGLVTDPDSISFTFATVGATPAGLTFNADGSYAYQPPPDFNGLVQFQYTAHDGVAPSNEATVTIEVTPVNDAPVTINGTYFHGVEDGQITGNLGLAAFDADGDVLTYRLRGAPVSGRIDFHANGDFVYTPNHDFFGTDSLRISVVDSHGAASLTTVVGLTVAPVNDAPVAFDFAGAYLEDAPIFRGRVTARDPDLDALTFRTVGPVPEGLVFDASGSFQGPLAPNFTATVSFNFEADDGHGNTDMGTVTIVGEARNDPPIANDDTVATAYQTSVDFDVKANDFDEEGDPVTAILFRQPNHGSVVVNADNTFTYTPADGFFGNDDFAYWNADFTNVDASNFATVFITVGRPPNVAPVAGDDRFEFDNLTPWFTVSPGLLANDTDLFPEELSVQSHTQPDHGSVTVGAKGVFTYVPEPGFIGSTTFTYVLSDGELTDGATVTFVVYDATPAQDDAYTTLQGQALVVGAPGLLGNDLDLEIVVAHTQPSHGTVSVAAGGSFVYTPAPNFFGTDSFSYTASGLVTDDATVTITVQSAARINGASADAGLAPLLLMGVLDDVPAM